MKPKGFLFTLHSWTGLFTGLFILLMSLSGSLLVFHEELDGLQLPAIETTAGKGLLTIDSVYRIIHRKYTNARISNLQLARSVNQPYVFSIYDAAYQKGKTVQQIFLHPQNGNKLLTRGGSSDIRHNFMSWLAALHNSFHLNKKGEWLLGFFGILFILNLITGMVLFRKKIIPVLLFRKRMFTKTNLHQLVGTYALIFNLLIAITGVWMQRYVFKKDFYTTQPTYVSVWKSSPALYVNIDSALNIAKKAYPEFTAYVVYFDQSKKSLTAVYGSRAGNAFIHSKKFADVLFLDSSGTVAKTAFVNNIDADSRYDIINSQVHFGKFGGLSVKIAYALLGLSGGALGISGLLLWLRRKNSKNRV